MDEKKMKKHERYLYLPSYLLRLFKLIMKKIKHKTNTLHKIKEKR